MKGRQEEPIGQEGRENRDRETGDRKNGEREQKEGRIVKEK